MKPNINDGKDWSRSDIDDLVTFAKRDESLEETANFLCRSDIQEVVSKAQELGFELRPDDGTQWRRLV